MPTAQEIELPKDENFVQTTSIPGLASGCQEEEPSFQLWEKKERGGALKEMFFWKVRTVKMPPPRQQPERKKNQETQSKAEAETLDKTCKNGIDRTVYKLLTKQMRKKMKRNQKEDEKNEKEEERKVGWRGPREQPSEIPVRRKILNKNDLVQQVSFINKLILIMTNLNLTGI